MENELNVRENKRGAFTLIEILIVMVLMAFLMSITMKLFSDTDKAKKILLMQDEMTKIAEGFQKFKSEMGVTPYDLEMLVGAQSHCNSKKIDISKVWDGPYYNGNIQLYTADGTIWSTPTDTCSADGKAVGGFEDELSVDSAGVITYNTAPQDFAYGAFIDLMQDDTGGLSTVADTIIIGLGKRKITDANSIDKCQTGVIATTSNTDYVGWLRASASKMSGIPAIDLQTNGGTVTSKAQYAEKADSSSSTIFIPTSKLPCSKF